MMNKRGWEARPYVIALILVSAIIGLSYLMVGSLAVEYDNTKIVDDSFSDNYNQLDENTGDVSSMLDATSNKDGLSILGTAEILLSSTFSVINIIFGSLKTIGSQVGSLGNDFGIPTPVLSIVAITFLAIITVSIIFIIINAVNKTSRL